MNSKAVVAVLGPKGTFTELAARKVFPKNKLLYCEDIEDIFSFVEKENVLGVVPIENSLEGSVNLTMDCLIKYDIKILKEIDLAITLCAMIPKGVKPNKVEAVISHPHALAQCRGFIKKKFGGRRIERAESTAYAMKLAGAMKNACAIGPKFASEEYGLEVLEEGVEDSPSKTRFIVIGRKADRYGREKTSIIFALKDRPGALYELLGAFVKRSINLTKIESRPSKRKLGEYMFFLDSEGNLGGGIIREIKPKTNFLKNLGSYDKAR